MPIARVHRVGDLDVAPGRSALVRLGLRGGAKAAWAVPAWVAVGGQPGPQVSVVAAAHGHEAAAALAAQALIREMDVGRMSGSLLVVPVFRPAGRFARPGRIGKPISLPGDAGGGGRARLAFSLHAEVIVHAQHVIELGGPRPARRSVLLASGDLDDPRARKLAVASGAAAVIADGGEPGSLLRAAREAGRVAVRLSAANGNEPEDAATLLMAVRRVLAALGVCTWPAPATPSRALVLDGMADVRAPADGLLEGALPPGAYVRKRAALGRIGDLASTRATPLLSPAAGLVVEAPACPTARRGSLLYRIGLLSPPVPASAVAARAGDRGYKVRTGWVEQVSLPDLGLDDVQAKIDTGARTSALHVTATRLVSAAAPHRRPILEITVPAGVGGRRRVVARVPVREYVDVRDTSGRRERRPVIETTLQLGPLRRKVRVTLTDRGDMRCPMLVGRTAVGGDVTVDPAARHLLGGARRR